MSGTNTEPFTPPDMGRIAGDALIKISNMLLEGVDNWFISPLVRYMGSLAQLQKKKQIGPVSCISISFLNTALQCGEPAYRVDAYGEDWMLYEHSLYTQHIDCSWFLPIWKKLLEDFQSILDSQAIQKYCSPLQAEQAAWKCIGPLISMMGSYLKYLFYGFQEKEEYQRVVKGDDFQLEFGEFFDWKVVLIGEHQEVDIFNSSGRLFSHRRFHKKCFDQKNFAKLDLKGCKFEACKFQKCRFSDAVLNDCIFENCEFTDTFFSKCLLAGAEFNNNTINHTKFEGVIAAFEGIPQRQVDDWYRPMQMLHTSINHVEFVDCFLNDCILQQCTTTFTMVVSSAVENSDFAILQNETLE